MGKAQGWIVGDPAKDWQEIACLRRQPVQLQVCGRVRRRAYAPHSVLKGADRQVVDPQSPGHTATVGVGPGTQHRVTLQIAEIHALANCESAAYAGCFCLLTRLEEPGLDAGVKPGHVVD